MVPGASVTDVAYFQGPAGVISSISPVSGSLLVDAAVVSGLAVSQRADLSYLLRASIPATATPGQAVAMRYSWQSPQGVQSKTTHLGHVLEPGTVLYSPQRVPFEFRVNGELVTPDTSVSVLVNCSGAEQGVPFTTEGTGSYYASVPILTETKSYELIVEIVHQGQTIYQTIRLYPAQEAVVNQTINTIQTSQANQGRSLSTASRRGLRIAPVRRTTLRVKT